MTEDKTFEQFLEEHFKILEIADTEVYTKDLVKSLMLTAWNGGRAALLDDMIKDKKANRER